MNFKFKQLLSALGIAIILGVAIYFFGLSRGNLITIKITPTDGELGSALGLSLQHYLPPLKVSRGQLVGGGNIPKWFDAYSIASSTAITFDEFKRKADPQYIAFYGITKDLFEKGRQATFDNPGAYVLIPWTVEILLNTEHYLVIAKQVFIPGLTDTGKQRPPLGVSLLKKIDGVWKLYPPELVKGFTFLPIDQAKLSKLIEIRRAHYQGNELVPGF